VAGRGLDPATPEPGTGLDAQVPNGVTLSLLSRPSKPVAPRIRGERNRLMTSTSGILAGILRGERRRGLGEAWDCRYHCYLDAASGRMVKHRPSLRPHSARSVYESSRECEEKDRELLLRAS